MFPNRRYAVIGAVLGILLLAGCGGSKEEEAQKAIQKGDTFYQNELYSDALSYYEGALEALPTDAQLHLRIGMCRENLGKLEDAIRSYEVAIRLDSSIQEAYRRKGSLLISESKLDEAEAFAKEVIAKEGMEGTGLFIRGEVARAKGDFENAVADLEKSLELDPGVSKTEESLVQAYQASGQVKPAINMIERLIEKKPGDINLVAQLAFLYESEGNVQRAISLISGLIKDHPENARLRSALARLYLAEGQLDQAGVEAREALSLDPEDPGALYVTGSIAFEKGELDQAFEDLKAANERSPNDAMIHAAFRDAQAATGVYLDPVRTLKEKIEETGGNPALWVRLADAYLFIGDAPSALVELQKVLDENPEHRDALIVQAHSLSSMGNRAAAEAVLERIGETDNPRIKALRGILAKGHGFGYGGCGRDEE